MGDLDDDLSDIGYGKEWLYHPNLLRSVDWNKGNNSRIKKYSKDYNGENTFDKSLGLDLKYGISEGFTLDATLIPDFGQTAFE